MPQWFLDEPQLPPFADFFLRHFWVLDTERPLGMTQGRIPESKVAEYGYRHGWPDDIIELFSHIVLELDRAYLSWCQKERERKAAQDKSK